MIITDIKQIDCIAEETFGNTKGIVSVDKYTTFSEIGKRRANQDVCRVVEMPEYNRALMIVC